MKATGTKAENDSTCTHARGLLFPVNARWDGGDYSLVPFHYGIFQREL